MFSCIALAGGKSQRLGRDKLKEQIGGRELLSRVTDRLSELGSDIIIVAGTGQDTSFFPSGKKLKVVTDVIFGGGVLGGIYTGLTVSDSIRNLVVACDMPFLNTALLGYLIETGEGCDAVVPRLNGFIEPLHAVYSRSCIDPIKDEIERGSRDIRSFFSEIKIKYVENREIDRFDPEHLSFFNINSGDDLAKARELAGRNG